MNLYVYKIGSKIHLLRSQIAAFRLFLSLSLSIYIYIYHDKIE